MKIKKINLPWNQITGRERKPLVLPRRDRWDDGIPTAEITLTVKLIEEFRVLKKLVLDDKWCFIILDPLDEIKIIAFDDDGRHYDVTLPEEIKYYRPGPHGYRNEYWNYEQ